MALQARIDQIQTAFTPLPSTLDAFAAAIQQIISPQRRLGHIDGLKLALGDHENLFFSETLPAIVTRACTWPQLFPDGLKLMPSLPRAATATTATLSFEQAACVLAAQFLCALPPPQDLMSTNIELPIENTFLTLFEAREGPEIAKLQMFLASFTHFQSEPLSGNLVIVRQVTPAAMTTAEAWSSSQLPLQPIEVDDSGMIEDHPNTIQVDFANAMIGGGVLCGGNVQEEIRFSTEPLLTCTLAFVEVAQDHEAIHLIGSRPYAGYTGYGGNLRFSPLSDDANLPQQLEDSTHTSYLCAIDAVPHPRSSQYGIEGRLRECCKALAGFTTPDHLPHAEMWQQWSVTTGNWGCGVFGGYRPLKSLLQWMAASASNRKMIYCTFDQGSSPFGQELAQLASVAVAKRVTVGTLWQLVDDVISRTLATKDTSELKALLAVLVTKINAL
eukprot:m.52931 g.52931  ORF g.52931 m.52931 type:complete len:443 (+) comp13532_c0_seq4:218-1546(+)